MLLCVSGLVMLYEAKLITDWRVHPQMYHLEIQRVQTGGWCTVVHPYDLLESERKVSFSDI